MDTIPSSFIPHDTAQSAAPSRGYSSGAVFPEIFMVLAIVLCGASLAVAAAVFLYVQYLDTVSASKLAQLERAKEALDPGLIVQLTRLEDRMHAADTLLSNHLAPATFFDALSLATLQTVSFGSLDIDLPDQHQMNLKLTGVAQSVNSVALQAELFGKNGVITNPIFSGISRQADGVHFSVTASVAPRAISFADVAAGTATASTSASAPAAALQPQQSAGQPVPSPFDAPAPQQP